MKRGGKICLLLSLFSLAALSRAAPVRAGDFETIRGVTYVERESGELKADVYVPAGDGPFPGVLAVHGGAWRMGSKWQMAGYAQKLADAGFTVVSINYRLAPDHKFPAQIEDCKSAVRWMRKSAPKYKIDATRIGAVGYSAGGHLVALLGTTDPACGLEGPDADGTSTQLQCVVAGGAPCDFRLIPPNSEGLAYWLGGSRAEKPEAYELASPLKFVTKDDPPILFFHGDADMLVPLVGPKAMVKKLGEVGVPAQLYTIAGAGHIPAFADPKAHEETIKFFRENLKRPAKAVN
jgi:acetyl esterase/lipase